MGSALLCRDQILAAFAFDSLPPDWVVRSLSQAPWVVVRRAPWRANRIPVGIRGGARTQRAAAWLDPRHVERRLAPWELRGRASALEASRLALPAMQALAAVEQAWSDWPDLCWGPGGSVGFELATGLASVGNGSDLDLVVRLARAISRSEARALWKRLPHPGQARIDVQLQTPAGAVALSEYAMGAGPMLLRSARGVRLTRDPWAETPWAEVA